MLAILWLIVWATVGDAFYEDYNWYTSDDGVTDERTLDSQREVHENFSDILRSFADSYVPTREGDDELTLAKVKSRLRMLKVFTYSTGNSKEFEPSNGVVLPLREGARFCTMGRHTKVDCNHCTCVAGQLYMCTGMICAKPPAKPQSSIICKEGKRRKIDSCNYCYCRNGHEICSTRDCRHNHDHLLIRSQYTCHEGTRRQVDCNRCLCRNGEEYCTKKKCTKKSSRPTKLKQDNQMPEGRCNDGQTLKIDCRFCKCTQNRWRCSDKNCGLKKKTEKKLRAKCREGTTRQLDACNKCYCFFEREFCEQKNCYEEQHLQYYRNLRYHEKPCDEGSYRKVDSCNYCLCMNGTEMCTTRPCPENYIEEISPVCKKGSVHQIDPCNYCTCPNGIYFCTNNPCAERLITEENFLRRRKECDRWDVKYEKCNRCECQARRWVCTKKLCDGDAGQESETGGEGGLKNNDNYFYLEVCNPGQTRKIDDCNTCFCRGGQWFCQIQECNEISSKISKLPALKIQVINFFKNLHEKKTSIVDNLPIFDQLEIKEHANNHNPDPENKKIFFPENMVDDVGTLFPKKSENNEDNENIGPYEIQSKNSMKEIDEPALVVEEPLCKPGSKKKIDACNTCHCRKGLWFCENKDCGPDLADLPPNCTKGHKIIIDCVPCTCQRRGWQCYVRKRKRNCTPDKKEELTARELPLSLRMIYSQDDDDDDQPKKCEIGERFRMDSCNYCYCNRDRELVCSNNNCPYPQFSDDDAKYQPFPVDDTEKQCKIGSRFRKGECNYCYCNYDHHLVCSKNQCTRKSSTGLSDEKELLRFTPAPKICLPHERFRLDNCNWCYCNRMRQRVCEQNPCSPKQKPDTRWPPNSPRRGCYIGSRFTRGKCGYCYCSVYRRIECRIRYNCTVDNSTTPRPKTPKTPATKPRTSLNFECEVGEIQRIDDCNFCRCTFSRKWMCSDNVCPSNYDDHNFSLSRTKLCTEGIRRQVDACNYCVCHSGVEFCTQKSCWKDTVSTIFSEPECLVGDPVPAPDSCNLCICLDSDILCTDNPCIQRQSANKKSRCVEGHKYKMDDGCNFCICQGGQEFCTSRACLVQDNFVSNSADCNEGEVTPAEDRCNMCVCMRGKIICTNKNCSRRKLRDAISKSLLSYIRSQKIKKHNMAQGTTQRCSPGKKYFPEDFDPNCPNECICDKHELLCTKRKCYNNNWDKQTPFKWPLASVKEEARNSKPSFKQENCVEYQKLPSDDPCNSCMCLNARKVCTIITCTEDNEGELGSDEAMFNNNPQGSKGNKGNMEKKNNTFCEPFTFFSPDNNRFCRNCFCLHNGLALCLLNLCKYSKDIPHQHSPEELDEVCNPGETGYPTKCVTCTCSEQGKWICTREQLALCQERDCDEKDEFHMGFLPYCAGCKCSVKEWFCSIQTETCRDYSNATCPLGSFIHNPRQHCSICLCGGYEEGSHNMCFTEAKCVRQVISQLKQ